MTHDLDPRARTLLRELDPATGPDPMSGHRRDTLTSILAADPDQRDGATVVALPTRRTLPRWAVPTAAAAAAIGVAISVPAIGGGQPAYASWTTTPTALSDAQADKLVKACLEQVSQSPGRSPADEFPPGVEPPPTLDPSTLTRRVADRRGDWASVLLTAQGPGNYDWSVSCIGSMPAGSTGDPSDVSSTVGGGGGFQTPTGRQFTQGAISEFGGSAGVLGLGKRPTLSATDGRVGPDVAGVKITSGGVTVQASVQDGTYAAWWPGSAFTPDRGPSGYGGPTPTISYTLTLKDGTVIKDAKPTIPPAVGSTVAGSAAVSGGDRSSVNSG